jgi:hypothetical protein
MSVVMALLLIRHSDFYLMFRMNDPLAVFHSINDPN